MALSLSELDTVLKEYYTGVVNEILNNSTVLLKHISRDSNVNVEGKYAVVPFRYGRNLSAGIGVAEGGALPTAGNQKYQRSLVRQKYIYATIQVNGQTIRATKTDAGAFVRAVSSEIKGVTDDVKRSVNRQLHGDGTDALAYWTAADNASPIVVDDNQANPFTHLFPGQAASCDLIDASDHTTLLNTGALAVSLVGTQDADSVDISYTGGTVAGSADGDYLVLSGTIGKQLMGLRGIISDVDPPNAGGTLASGLQDVPVASNAWWKSQIVGSRTAKRDLSFRDMQQVLSKISANSAYTDKDVSILLCSHEVRDRYFELARAERFTTNTMVLDGGFEALSYNSHAVTPDNQCDKSTMWFLVPDALAIYQMAMFEWIDDGSGVLRHVPGFDSYNAVMFTYCNLGTSNRPALGALLGVTQ